MLWDSPQERKFQRRLLPSATTRRAGTCVSVIARGAAGSPHGYRRGRWGLRAGGVGRPSSPGHCAVAPCRWHPPPGLPSPRHVPIPTLFPLAGPIDAGRATVGGAGWGVRGFEVGAGWAKPAATEVRTTRPRPPSGHTHTCKDCLYHIWVFRIDELTPG